MALNIIVETVIQPYATLRAQDYVYNAGTIIFDKEGFRNSSLGEPVSGVKVGDGATNWKRLPYLSVTEEIVSKWRQIAEGAGITNSKLVTLPDMNFAYAVVDVEKNQELIDTIMTRLIQDELYYKVSSASSVLKIEGLGNLDFSLPNTLDREDTISKISFTSSEKTSKINGTKTFLIKDAAAWQRLASLETNVNSQINNALAQKEELTRLNIRPSENMANSQINFYLRNPETALLNKYPSATLLATNLANSTEQRFYLNLYHQNVVNEENAQVRYYTQYRFPTIQETNETKYYRILTSNFSQWESGDVIPVTCGGTGASAAREACRNLNTIYCGKDYQGHTDGNWQKIGQIVYTGISSVRQVANNGTNSDYDYVSLTFSDDKTIKGVCDPRKREFAFYIKDFTTTDNGQSTTKTRYCIGHDNVRVESGSSVLRGAAWNDYAEAREANTLEAGRVVVEKGDGSMVVSSERLMPSAKITSDTFGFIIGESETSKTPIAVCGRVLAYPNEDKNSYSLGDAVCSGPNGTVSKMTREEIINYPERIVGTVSEIPNYEVWGEEKVKVNGRIWIYVR